MTIGLWVIDNNDTRKGLRLLIYYGVWTLHVVLSDLNLRLSKERESPRGVTDPTKLKV